MQAVDWLLVVFIWLKIPKKISQSQAYTKFPAKCRFLEKKKQDNGMKNENLKNATKQFPPLASLF